MDIVFTVEESNLICIFAGEGRSEVIEIRIDVTDISE